jgi:hypothetical protein
VSSVELSSRIDPLQVTKERKVCLCGNTHIRGGEEGMKGAY